MDSFRAGLFLRGIVFSILLIILSSYGHAGSFALFMLFAMIVSGIFGVISHNESDDSDGFNLLLMILWKLVLLAAFGACFYLDMLQIQKFNEAMEAYLAIPYSRYAPPSPPDVSISIIPSTIIIMIEIVSIFKSLERLDVPIPRWLQLIVSEVADNINGLLELGKMTGGPRSGLRGLRDSYRDDW
jgi:hypothetical protein